MLWRIARGLSLNQNRGYILRNPETRRIKELLQQTMLQSKFSHLFNFVCNRIETYRSLESLNACKLHACCHYFCNWRYAENRLKLKTGYAENITELIVTIYCYFDLKVNICNCGNLV